MTTDTQEIVRVKVPAVGWPLGNQRVSAFLLPGPDRDAEDVETPRRRPLPYGVEGHRLGNRRVVTR